MISKLRIRNYQSHRDSTLEFSPGVNVIIGETDHGKSSVIRALRWLIWNKPVGEAFRSWWGGDTIVDLDLDVGQVSRLRADKFNGYVLEMHDEFEAIKTDVPEEIKQLLNMDETNLQRQLDRHFLLCDSPGEVAQHFNKVARLDKIDTGGQNVQKWIREITQDITYKEKEIERLTEQQKQFEHLEKFEADVEVLEGLETRRNKLARDHERLSTLVGRAKTVQQLIDEERSVLIIEPQLNTLLEQISRRDEMKDKLNQLSNIVEKAKAIQGRIDEESVVLTIEPQLNTLLEKIARRDLLKEKLALLSRITIKATNTVNAIKDAEFAYEQAQKEFKLNFPRVCPLCGQEVKK